MPRSIHENVCEESVFSKLFEKYATSLYNFLYYKYGERYLPEDKVQEAFVKLWEKCKDVPFEKAKSFLFTVASNSSLNEIKHEKVVLKYQNSSPKLVTNESPEFVLEEKEYLVKYQTALANLTEGQRVAFLLNRIEGKKHREIAEILGISIKAVEKRIYGALKQLRKEIELIK